MENNINAIDTNVTTTFSVEVPEKIVKTDAERARILSIKAKIKDLATEGKACRELIRNSKGLEKHGHWSDKRSIGSDARFFLLLYGFLRGRKYSNIEKNVEIKPSYFTAEKLEWIWPTEFRTFFSSPEEYASFKEWIAGT